MPRLPDLDQRFVPPVPRAARTTASVSRPGRGGQAGGLKMNRIAGPRSRPTRRAGREPIVWRPLITTATRSRGRGLVGGRWSKAAIPTEAAGSAGDPWPPATAPAGPPGSRRLRPARRPRRRPGVIGNTQLAYPPRGQGVGGHAPRPARPAGLPSARARVRVGGGRQARPPITRVDPANQGRDATDQPAAADRDQHRVPGWRRPGWRRPG